MADRLGLPFQSLQVWQKSIVLCDDLLASLEGFPNQYRFSLGDQLQRAAISISANIAEGTGREHDADKKRFFTISRGSSYEVFSLLELAKKRKLLQEEKAGGFQERCIEIVRMLSGLIH